MPPPDFSLRVGVDAVEVERMTRLIEDHPSSSGEIFTAQELEYCESKRRSSEHLAARFAAKEAVLKALGTGIIQRMRWTDVEVVNDARGRPQMNLNGAVASFAQRHGLTGLDVSLTHTKGLAIAHVVSVWTRSERDETCAST
ncbi:MAG: holo-ACP synthase [Solirubrobacteraceae bacterium]